MNALEEKLRHSGITIRDVNESTITHDVPEWNQLSINEDDEQFRELFLNIINDPGIPDESDSQIDNDINDTHINMEIGLPRGADGDIQRAVVKRRATGEDGKPLSVASTNPLTNTRLYEVEFLDGNTEVMAAKVIADFARGSAFHNCKLNIAISSVIQFGWPNPASDLNTTQS